MGRHCVKLQRYREDSILALRVFANWGKSWGNEHTLKREGAVIHKVLKDTEAWEANPACDFREVYQGAGGC